MSARLNAQSEDYSMILETTTESTETSNAGRRIRWEEVSNEY